MGWEAGSIPEKSCPACLTTLIDTTVWIDYFRNRSTPETDWLDREVSRQRLGLTDLILCEVLQGIRTPREFDATRAALEQFEIFSTGGIALAVTAAQHYQTLRLQGVNIRKMIDCLIACFTATNFCITTEATIHSKSDWVFALSMHKRLEEKLRLSRKEY